MRPKERRLILGLLIILVLIVVVKVRSGNKNEASSAVVSTNGYITTLADGTKVNTNEALKRTKMFDGLEFTDIQLTNKNGQTVLLANIENKGTSETDLQLVDVIMVDEKGEQLATVGGIVSPLQVGETTQFNVSMTRDYTHIYDFQIVEKKGE